MSNLRGKIKHASRQSGLSRWLHSNHVWFGKELKQAVVPNWDQITIMFEREGLIDRNGNPYTKDAIRIGVDRFFKKFPALLPATTYGMPKPQPPEIEHPTASITSPSDVSREIPELAQPDYIAISQAIKNKRTVK